MDLSPTAMAYLATLKRYPAVSVKQVVEALKRAECPVFESWLEFHEQFGGYKEVIGRDVAYWGIVHTNPGWPWEANEVYVQTRRNEWFVNCADVHPSYDYRLDSSGQFLSVGGGGYYESFVKKVERDAMARAAAAGGRRWREAVELRSKVEENVEAFVGWSGAELVGEASDKYMTCWRGNDTIIYRREIIDNKEGWIKVWVAEDARERMSAYQPDPA